MWIAIKGLTIIDNEQPSRRTWCRCLLLKYLIVINHRKRQNCLE